MNKFRPGRRYITGNYKRDSIIFLNEFAKEYSFSRAKIFELGFVFAYRNFNEFKDYFENADISSIAIEEKTYFGGYIRDTYYNNFKDFVEDYNLDKIYKNKISFVRFADIIIEFLKENQSEVLDLIYNKGIFIV